MLTWKVYWIRPTELESLLQREQGQTGKRDHRIDKYSLELEGVMFNNACYVIITWQEEILLLGSS